MTAFKVGEEWPTIRKGFRPYFFTPAFQYRSISWPQRHRDTPNCLQCDCDEMERYQFVTTVSGCDAPAPLVVLMRKRLPSAVTSYSIETSPALNVMRASNRATGVSALKEAVAGSARPALAAARRQPRKALF
jgi:hypothetical protein